MCVIRRPTSATLASCLDMNRPTTSKEVWTKRCVGTWRIFRALNPQTRSRVLLSYRRTLSAVKAFPRCCQFACERVGRIVTHSRNLLTLKSQVTSRLLRGEYGEVLVRIGLCADPQPGATIKCQNKITAAIP